MTTFIIAEAGSTWRIGKNQIRHLAYACEAIRVAKDCGADACKFQWTSDPAMMEQRRKVPVGSYEILAWPKKWLRVLAAECEDAGIEFMCTVFLVKDVPMIAPLVKRFKVASLEADDKVLIETCRQYGKPIIVSSGCSDHCQPKDIITLQCTAAYPAPLAALNLDVLRDEPFESGSPFDGLSDHSGDTLTGALAVACGAEIVEVHFRLFDTPTDNPDYKHSHDAASLKQYIANIRKAELMLGDGVKKVEKCEEPMLKHRVMP